MSKKTIFGILLISIFILSSIFAVMAVNIQSNKSITQDLNKIVTKADLEKPKILEVIQNPVTLTFQQPVNVTAHLTDNIQIQTALIETNYTGTGVGDYLGVDSFTNDADGAEPAGWTCYHASGISANVINASNGHRKVVDEFDNNSSQECNIRQDFGANKETGTIELYVQMALSNGGGSIGIMHVWGSWEIGLQWTAATSKFQYWSGGGIYDMGVTVTPNHWYHMRFSWDGTARIWWLWLDGVSEDGGAGWPFFGVNGDASLIVIYCGDPATVGCHQYVDAVDYSWASGYFTNRNMISAGFTNYTMTQQSGTQSDGLWTYTFNNYPTNESIFYRVFAEDSSGNWNATGYYNFGYFDLLCPNIAGVFQVPKILNYQDIVNVTAHITDATQVLNVYIESNYTGTVSSYLMSLINGTSKDGMWKFSFGSYPVNKTISYRLFARDILGNQNVTSYYSFEYYSIFCPNIISVSQTPTNPTYQDIVNVSAHITDGTQILNVNIETNYTGTVSSYLMSFINGTSKDGIWKFSFTNYPINKVVSYCINARDDVGSFNRSIQSSFRVLDLISPSIVSVLQTPSNLTKWESVKVTAHVQENLAIVAVNLTSNFTESWGSYSMTQLNGTLKDGFWEYTFLKTAYPYNRTIWYHISAIDVGGLITTTSDSNFGIFPLITYYVPRDLKIKIDIGMAGNHKGDIIFNFKNTGNTNWVNINFTIRIPVGWTVNPSVISISKLAPGQNVTITFKITVSNQSEFLQLLSIDVNAVISELGIQWTKTIQVVVSGEKVWDFFIWLTVIVGSASAALALIYVYIHKRPARQHAPKIKEKGKSLASLKTAISTDFPGNYSKYSRI